MYREEIEMIEDDGPPLISQILPMQWQGGTDDEITTYPGNRRLHSLGDPPPLDSLVSLSIYTLLVGWLDNELPNVFAEGVIDSERIEDMEQVADWVYAEIEAGMKISIRC